MIRITACVGIAMFVLGLANIAAAQSAGSRYPAMAPHDKYMMDTAAEIALARSAAVPAISDEASVLVLGPNGFTTAVKGSGHFTCLVERSWDKTTDDPEFWDDKIRAPVCMNEAAVRTVLPMIMERAEWALADTSRDEMDARSKSSRKAVIVPTIGAMSYMMSKSQYLSDDAPTQWHPHVMFFSPATDATAWGANLKGSPVLSGVLTSQITLFFIPVRKWSDGTLADYGPPPPETDQHYH
jgi:hypothetical protein